MRLEHYPLEKLKSELLEIVGNELDLATHKLFFFGSRVTGKGTESSDIDVGILGETEIDINRMARIRDKIENIRTLYKIDFVDFKLVSDDFKNVAMSNVEYIN